MAPPTMEKPQRTAEETTDNEDVSHSGSGSAEETAPVRKKKTRKGKKKSSALDKVGEVGGVQNLADDTLGGVTNTLGNVGNQALQNQQNQNEGGGSGKSDTLRLRLDLNLDIEIQLKARIHGDLELALLN